MSTLRKTRPVRISKQDSTKSQRSIKRTSRGLKAALIGLLLILIGTMSGCVSRSNLPVEPQDLTVDASLMVKPNLTKQLLDVLSE